MRRASCLVNIFQEQLRNVLSQEKSFVLIGQKQRLVIVTVIELCLNVWLQMEGTWFPLLFSKNFESLLLLWLLCHSQYLKPHLTDESRSGVLI